MYEDIATLVEALKEIQYCCEKYYKKEYYCKRCPLSINDFDCGILEGGIPCNWDINNITKVTLD